MSRLTHADIERQKIRDLIAAIDRELPRYIDMLPDGVERLKIEKQRVELLEKLNTK
jgi:hypothetical protein